MSTFSGRQFKGASRHMKQLKREEAEKRQAVHDARMKELANVLVEVDSLEEFQTVLGVVEYQEDAVGLYPVVQVEAPKKRVRARHRKTTTEGK